MRSRSGWIVGALTVAVALYGCSSAPTSTTSPSSSPSSPSSSSSSSSSSPPPQVISADPAFAALEAQYGARLGVFVIDTATGTELAWRADERFAYASTHKALTAGALLDEVGIAGLQETVAIGAGDPIGHSPVTELRVGTQMTLGELAAAAVQQSDNGAANLIFERLGGPAAFGGMLQELGDNVSTVARTELELNDAVPGDLRDTSSPRAFARDLQAYTLGSAALNAAEKEMLIRWMSNSTTGDTLIRAGAPEGWTVADKSGAGGYGTRNNIAVLWPPSGSPDAGSPNAGSPNAGSPNAGSPNGSGSTRSAPVVMAVMSSRDSADADYNDQLIADAAAAAIAAFTAGD